jgi:hypothetical protein
MAVAYSGGDTFYRKFPIKLDDYKSKWGELLMTSTQFKNPANSGIEGFNSSAILQQFFIPTD